VLQLIGPATLLPAEVTGGQPVQPQAADLPSFLTGRRNAPDTVLAAVGDPLTLDLLGGP
jgi:hypothetical protein